MAQKFLFKLNSNGVRQLLQSDAMTSGLAGLAGSIVNRAGSGYDSNTNIGKKRATARVYTTDRAAFKDNLRNNTLLKSVR